MKRNKNFHVGFMGGWVSVAICLGLGQKVTVGSALFVAGIFMFLAIITHIFGGSDAD